MGAVVGMVAAAVVVMIVAHDTTDDHHGGDPALVRLVDDHPAVDLDRPDTTGGRFQIHQRDSHQNHQKEVCPVVGPEARPNLPQDLPVN